MQEKADIEAAVREAAAKFRPCVECREHEEGRGDGMPQTSSVAALLRRLFALLFPGCHGAGNERTAPCGERAARAFARISPCVRPRAHAHATFVRKRRSTSYRCGPPFGGVLPAGAGLCAGPGLATGFGAGPGLTTGFGAGPPW